MPNITRMYPDVTHIGRPVLILQKVHPADLVPKKACVCGYQYNTRQLWLLVGLIFLATFSLMGTIFMWCTSSFDNIILNNLIISNGTDAFETFQNPITSSFVKVHIFNYTNIREFDEGLHPKLRVNDVGPYVYERFLERVNVQFNGDGTLSYQERSSFNFRADMSQGRRQSDRLVVPNMPMLSAAVNGKKTAPLAQWGMSQLFKMTESNAFKEVPAHRLLWGYDDRLYDLARFLSSSLPYEKFGILANKNGTSPDIVTIHTGENGFEKFGYISAYNGETEIPHWSTAECRKIEGSDASYFPPHLVRQKERVHWYAKDFCRRMPMDFNEEVKIFNNTVPAYRYIIPYDVFDDPSINNENQCYCDLDSSACPPQGVFNTTPCAFEAPAFISFPHFYLADPKVRHAVEGMHPNPAKHLSYIDLHPKMGFLLSGHTRIQLNIQVKKSFGISQLDRFDDDMLLPVAWIDIGLDETNMSKEAVDLIYLSTFTAEGIERALRYGFLLLHLVTLVFIILLVKGRYHQRVVERRSIREDRRLLA